MLETFKQIMEPYCNRRLWAWRRREWNRLPYTNDNVYYTSYSQPMIVNENDDMMKMGLICFIIFMISVLILLARK